MKILTPLKHRSLRYLWSGQVFSSVGDELYAVAIVWIAVRLLGSNAGYVIAIQALALLFFGLFSGIWVDRWNQQKILFWTDIVRAIAILTLPLVAYLTDITVWILIPVTILVSGLNALFSPTLNATLPLLAKEKDLLQSTNALMETTSRLAKVLGPGTVAILSQIVPVIHYFTIDAISFLFSAGSIHALKKDLPSSQSRRQPQTWQSVKQSLLAGYHLAKSKPLIYFIILSEAVVNSAWLFIFPMAIGILLQERFTESVVDLSWVVAVYGVGNLISNLALGSTQIERYDYCLFTGRIIAGLGFILLAVSPHFSMVVACAGIAATGGPMVDLAKLTLIQKHFQPNEIAQVYRFSLSLVQFLCLIVLLVSPWLFAWVSVPIVIVAAASLMAAMGALGFILFRNPQES